MGGRLFLKNGYAPNRLNVCVSGYSSTKENYALSNIENNERKGYNFVDPDIGPVHFPTSEHYLHFQKLTPAAKISNLAAWQTQPSPGVLLAGIRSAGSPYYIRETDSKYATPGGGFNTTGWDRDKIAVQMQINATKYQQSAAFQQAIHQSIELGHSFQDGRGAATIIEDTSSASKEEKIWGTGPDGKGTNILGNTQTAFANMLMQGQVPKNSQPPSLSQYSTDYAKQHYDYAQSQYQSGVQIELQKVRALSGRHAGSSQPDTSDLGQALVDRVDVVGGKIVPPAPTTMTKPEISKAPSYENLASTKRLLLDTRGAIIGREWRNNTGERWQVGTDPGRFKDLEGLYLQSLAKRSADVHSYASSPAATTRSGTLTPAPYENANATKRLVFNEKGDISQREWRNPGETRWKIGGDPSKFTDLESLYKQSKARDSSMDIGRADASSSDEDTPSAHPPRR